MQIESLIIVQSLAHRRLVGGARAPASDWPLLVSVGGCRLQPPPSSSPPQPASVGSCWLLLATCPPSPCCCSWLLQEVVVCHPATDVANTAAHKLCPPSQQISTTAKSVRFKASPPQQREQAAWNADPLNIWISRQRTWQQCGSSGRKSGARTHSLL